MVADRSIAQVPKCLSRMGFISDWGSRIRVLFKNSCQCLVALVFWCSFSFGVLYAKGIFNPNKNVEEASEKAKPDFPSPFGSSKKKPTKAAPNKAELKGFPLIFNTPETGWGTGGVVVYFKKKSYKKASPLISGLMVTEKQQFVWALGTKQYFARDRAAFQAQLEASKFPDRFFGLGVQTNNQKFHLFTERKINLMTGIEGKIWTNLSAIAGMQIRTDSLDFDDTPDFDLKSQYDPPKSEGGISRGLRFHLFWDSTDDGFFPSRGEKTLLETANFRSVFGSDFEYRKYKLDSRVYRTLARRSVLASQILYENVEGAAPFYMMPKIGGKDVLRGYYQGRFRDRYMAIWQLEHRYRWKRKWSLVQFVGIGAVGGTVKELSEAEKRSSGGVGIRYQITSAQKVNLRLDIGKGSHSETPAVYVHVMEAF